MTKSCPYCAEEIRAEAVRCPHCRSRLGTFKPVEWHRDHPEVMAAGVAAALAHAFSLPVAWVRLGFVVASFVHLIGVIAYAALWLLIPKHPGEPSVLETALERAQQAARHMSARHGCGHCASKQGGNGGAADTPAPETPPHTTGA